MLKDLPASAHPHVVARAIVVSFLERGWL